MTIIDLSHIDSFDWDAGNLVKNVIGHAVSNKESEEVIFNRPVFFFEDEKHSLVEQRFLALGRSNVGRLLTIIFTVRESKIRVISARDMHRKERGTYEKLQKNT
jgi:uncharacterized protein